MLAVTVLRKKPPSVEMFSPGEGEAEQVDAA
jgi:hypothetical protein